jgi:hypothetical protein
MVLAYEFMAGSAYKKKLQRKPVAPRPPKAGCSATASFKFKIPIVEAIDPWAAPVI